MDATTLIVELVKALAWPVVVCFAIFQLRQPLGKLIPLVTSVKYKDLEVGFAKEVEKLKKETREIAQRKSITGVSKEESLGGYYVDLIQVSPSSAIIESWTDVETTMSKKLAEYHGTDGENIARNLSKQLERRLLELNKIDKETRDLIGRLRELRNRVVHTNDMRVSEETARNYVMATIIAKISVDSR